MESWLRPMLCGSADSPPVGPEWVIEGKLDGWRTVAHRTPNGVQVFCGRNGSNYTDRLPYIQDQLELILPPDSAVDGELIGYATGAQSPDVGSVMSANDQVRGEPLQLVLFDVIRLDGIDLRPHPWSARRDLLEAIRVDDVANIAIVPCAPSSVAAHNAMLAAGLEGSVCKLMASRYVNSRSNSWVKIKPQQTDEAKVVGFKPGTKGSAFDGLVGALELEMLGSGARTRASGFDMPTRREISANKDRWLGAIVEIKHHGLSKDGVPRHPQFLRRRDDRSPRTTKPRKPPSNKEVRRMAPTVRRNYGAMGDAKLLKVIGELRNGGDAAQRAEAKGFAAGEDLSIAEGIAHSRGLRVPAA